MHKSYSGADFVKALSERSLPLGLTTLPGFVDEGASTAEHISFSEGVRCTHWVKIPVSLIENVDYLGTRSCFDHVHPYVVLHLKSPPVENQEATAFAQLLMSRPQAAISRDPSGLYNIYYWDGHSWRHWGTCHDYELDRYLASCRAAYHNCRAEPV